MKPYYQKDGITVYCSDCDDMSSVVEYSSCDLVLTDPPYNVGKDYGNGVASDKKENYVEWLNSIWDYCALFVKEGSFLIYTNTTRFIPFGMNPPSSWKYFHLACWNKPLSLRPAFYGICPHWEPIFILLKGEKPWRKFRGKDILADVINANVVYDKSGNKKHPTPKPLELYLALAQWGCPLGGRILEPFGGTGTTAMAAKMLGMECIIFEQNPAYCEIIAKRCSQQVFNFGGAE